jgi:hypothetical protein
LVSSGAFVLNLEAPYKFDGEGLMGRLSVGPKLALGFDLQAFSEPAGIDT